MTDAQTEARAIEPMTLEGAICYDTGEKTVAAYGPWVTKADHDTALAAKDAELAEAKEQLQRQFDQTVRFQGYLVDAKAQLAEANKALVALANFAFWFRSYPEFKPNPDFLDEVVADREAALPFIPPARRAREQGGENGRR